MCQECKENKFIWLASNNDQCSVEFAKWWINNELDYYDNNIKDFLDYYIDNDGRSIDPELKINLDKIYNYVLEKYYPDVYKKYCAYILLK